MSDDVESLVSKESRFETLVLSVFDQCRIRYEAQKRLATTRRSMDIYIEDTDTAIELKVDSSQRKGVGQALDYKQECNESVLLVPESRYDERVHDICEDSGITYATLDVNDFEVVLSSSKRLQFLEYVRPDDLTIGYQPLRASGDAEGGEFDNEIMEAGTSIRQRERIDKVKGIIADVLEETANDCGAPLEDVLSRADEGDMGRDKLDHEIDKLKQRGEVYEPSTDLLRIVPGESE